MKTICPAIAFSIAILGSTLFAQDADPKSADNGDSIVHEFDTEIAKLNVAYLEKLQALRTAAAAKLTTLQKDVAADDLDAAIRLRDLAKKLVIDPVEPPQVNKTDVGSKEKRDAGNKHETLQKELRQKIAELEKQLGMQSELSKRIVGSSYRIQIGNDLRVWTFAPNGDLLNNGKPTATRCSAFGNDAVICAGYDNGFVDICQFSNDFRSIEVIFVGDYKKSKTHHVGAIVNRQ